MKTRLALPRRAGCQPATQRSTTPRYSAHTAPRRVAPIGNRLYRGLAVRQRTELPTLDTETGNRPREVVGG